MEDPLLRLGTYSFFKIDDFLEIFQTDFLRKLPSACEWEDQGSKIDYKSVVKCTEY